MYAYFKGTIVEKNIDGVVIEVAGIGYNIMTPQGKDYELPDVGDEAKIYTYTSVREDAMQLYGFARKEELALFKQLITVSGIGPKGGQAILSELSVDEIKMAIITGDSKTIARAPGVGKKTAERVIIDLKDKIQKEEIEFATEFVSGSSSAKSLSPEEQEAAEALTALGYNAKEAADAVAKASQEGIVDANKLLKGALKYL